MSNEGLRSEFATTAHERHTQILGKPVRQDFVAKMVYRRSKKGAFSYHSTASGPIYQ